MMPGDSTPIARELQAVADVLRDLALMSPPNLIAGWSSRSIRETLRAAALGNRLRKLGMGERQALLDLFTKSASEYLDGWFESEPVKALFAFDAVVGNIASPFTPGTAYVLLHHAFGEVNGRKGVWGHAIGGMGAVTQAMAAAAASMASRSRPTRRSARSSDRARSATAASSSNGRVVRGKAVAANVNLKLLYGADGARLTRCRPRSRTACAAGDAARARSG